MKKIFGIATIIALLMMTACDKGQDNVRITDVEIISIHDLTLKPGADVKEFEALVRNEIAPLYRQMKGQDLFLAKGYEGQRKGEYSIFITFITVEDRNRIYPLSGGFSDEFHKHMEGTEAMWEKFNSMAEGFDGFHCTDYLKVNQQ